MAADTGIIPVGDDQRAIRGDGDIGRPEPFVAGAFKYFNGFGGIPGSGFFDRITAHDIRAGVAVDHLVMENGGQKVAFINHDAGGAAGSGVEEVGNDAGIGEMPVAGDDFLF